MSPDVPMLARKSRATLGAVLESVLLHESQLAATTRACAWRVRGSPTQSVKRLFGEQARQIDRWVGEVMARARAIGAAISAGVPVASAEELGAEVAAPRTAAEALLRRHEAVIRELRAAAEVVNERDPDGDAALLVHGLLEFHETTVWMLRLLLESPERARVI